MSTSSIWKHADRNIPSNFSTRHEQQSAKNPAPSQGKHHIEAYSKTFGMLAIDSVAMAVGILLAANGDDRVRIVQPGPTPDSHLCVVKKRSEKHPLGKANGHACGTTSGAVWL